MKMDIQRLRNLTTGLLHTDIRHVYQDIEFFTGEKGLMTHMLPRANRALRPYLRNIIKDPRVWDEKYDPTHRGWIEVSEMGDAERGEFRVLYAAQPDPLLGKSVVILG